ncbi:MAG: membrane protein insertion efficiency factor YidD [Acidobacteria bacterium 37-65-4]|nr:MAG: membrane protein insertion efficiency factor YidD [Acidobacteria bacterium 37-65-4]
MRYLILALIKAYQWTLSPLLGGACRYYPSCSSYAYGAVERFGAIRGSWMGIKRILRCNPWFEGGCDPVPESGKGSK